MQVCLSLLTLLNSSAQAQTLPLPARSANALSGAEFIKRVTPLTLPERENEIFSQITSGNIPNFLRKLCPVQVTNIVAGRTNTANFYVTPDYLAIGSDADYFLTPISPNTAQRIADALNCSLPTRKMVDNIYAAAPVKLSPSPIPPSAAMTTVDVFNQHNQTIRAQRADQLAAHPIGALTAGHKKDVVLSPRLAAAPGKVAIYGWHQTNGAPIQPLYLGHTAAWVDYSQCIRPVQQPLLVNGQTQTVTEVLASPALSGLLSDEGPLPNPRYPTNALPQPASNPVAPIKTSPPGFTGFQASPYFNERLATFTLDPEVKVHINAPPQEQFTPNRMVLLIFYALPNGNTTDQTVGKTLKPGDDWHYDIQHIGAQTRFLRDRLLDRAIVVAYLENALKSWPAWRKKYGDRSIPEIIAAVEKIFSGHDLEIVLSGHSGGGSLTFGFLNTVPKIPNEIVRVAFLDSNYAYDPALGHKDKLAAWLKADNHHRLCILAYNDAVALLDGKPFVSAAGGTWGKSHEMQHDLAADFKFTSLTNADFQRFSALDGRVQFILKENPERKVLHTVQVERNGFIHSLLSGTPQENKGYEYFGPRAYTNWIQPD
jgi:hypothetical protein